MEKQKTAVEWQFEQLFNSFEKFNNGEYSFNDYLKKNLEIRDQAKQMEKEQIKQDVYNVCKLILSNPIEKSGKTPTELFDSYYESKYGKDEDKSD